MIIPTGSRLLVEEDKLKLATTDSGIIIGEDRVPQCIRCKVVAAGPSATIKVGQVIYAPQFSLTECRENVSKNTMIVPEEDIVAIEANE